MTQQFQKPDFHAMAAVAMQNARTAAPLLGLSREQFQNWQQNPSRIPNAQHEEHCSSGLVQVITGDGTTEGRTCPRCKVIKDQQAFRSKLRSSGIGEIYLDVEWSDLDRKNPFFQRMEKACQNIQAIIEHNQSLILHGDPGSGKTQVAILAAKSAIRAGRTAALFNIGRLCVDIRDGYDSKNLTEKMAIQQLASPDLLILDDVGAGEADSLKLERRILYLALEERMNHRKPAIITSNLKLMDPVLDPRSKEVIADHGLYAYLGGRILNRIQPCKAIHVDHGINYRIRKVEDLW